MRFPTAFALLFLLTLGGCFLASAQASVNHPITVEALQDRLAGLEKGRAQTLANLSAYDGAIVECQYWLDLAKKAEAAKPPPKTGGPKAKPEPPKPKPDAAKRPAP
jgi:hypothetical protein